MDDYIDIVAFENEATVDDLLEQLIIIKNKGKGHYRVVDGEYGMAICSIMIVNKNNEIMI